MLSSLLFFFFLNKNPDKFSLAKCQNSSDNSCVVNLLCLVLKHPKYGLQMKHIVVLKKTVKSLLTDLTNLLQINSRQ